jgi:hypothetical protein
LITYKQYDKQTDYRFTILEGVSGTCPSPTVAPEYQVIDGQCYKSVTKKLTKDEVQNYDCKKRDVLDELHPDEFCPPPKGQRIYVKFADTFYEDEEHTIPITLSNRTFYKDLHTNDIYRESPTTSSNLTLCRKSVNLITPGDNVTIRTRVTPADRAAIAAGTNEVEKRYIFNFITKDDLYDYVPISANANNYYT